MGEGGRNSEEEVGEEEREIELEDEEEEEPTKHIGDDR